MTAALLAPVLWGVPAAEGDVLTRAPHSPVDRTALTGRSVATRADLARPDTAVTPTLRGTARAAYRSASADLSASTVPREMSLPP